jgi:NADH dehydrogenase
MPQQKEVVIVGAGFGGLQAVKKLSKDKSLKITLIDRTNHHLFTPLLYQVATAVLSPADIAIPIRNLTKRMKNVTVIMENVTRIDLDKREVFCDNNLIKYDYLILTAGAQTSYFGHNEWENFTLGLKDLVDALRIRKQILFSFEEAENHPERANELLNYIIIGGGPTGVEMAGSIAELTHNIMKKEFRKIDTTKTKITLIEAGPKLLPTFDAKLSEYTKQSLEKRGVKVMLNTRVQNIEEHKIYISNEVLHSHLIIWAAGVEPVPVAQGLNLTHDKQKRIVVNEYCSVDEYPNVFVIGDDAHFEQDGHPLAGVSPVAMQQGRYVAKIIVNESKNEKREKPFRYINKGTMATIGRKDAVAEFAGLKLKGFMGWMIWLFIHLWYQVGFKNKISILVTWIWSYLTFGASARVIQTPIDSKDRFAF